MGNFYLKPKSADQNDSIFEEKQEQQEEEEEDGPASEIADSMSAVKP